MERFVLSLKLGARPRVAKTGLVSDTVGNGIACSKRVGPGDY